MKRLFLIWFVLLATMSICSGNNQAIVKIHPKFSASESTQARNALVCANRSTTIDSTGVSKYDQCIKMYGFKAAIENYFADNIEKLKSDSEKVKMETPNTTSWKADYMLYCGVGVMVDELKSESGWYKWDDEAWYESKWQEAMANGVYYMQFNCELTNIETGEIIHVTEGKRKTLTDNGLLSAKDMIDEGKALIERSFPKANELEGVIEGDIRFKNAEFYYTRDNENNKYANGKETGKLKITSLKPGYLSRNALTEFTLTAKQGKFTENMSQSIEFTDADFKKEDKISFPYQTYNCQDKEIKDKNFETFTLKITKQLTKEKSVLVKEFQYPFECLEPYYTVNTSQKTTSVLKAIEKYRGISADLKSYQVDKDTYYIYIDADNAKIVQYHVDVKSTRKIHRERYTLNYKSCLYEIDKEDKLVKNMGGRDILKSEDAGWGFEDDTKIYVTLPSSDKDLSFTWGRLRENGRYSNSKKYKKEIPQIAKNMMEKVNSMTAFFRKEGKNNKGMELWKSLYDYPGSAGTHVQCGGKVTMETFLIPPLDGLQNPDIEFSIKIRPSTKNEIKVIKKKMNIK